mgnify:CR=1 FL=1
MVRQWNNARSLHSNAARHGKHWNPASLIPGSSFLTWRFTPMGKNEDDQAASGRAGANRRRIPATHPDKCYSGKSGYVNAP